MPGVQRAQRERAEAGGLEEERLQVLRLVEAGRITPEQAAELLQALQGAGRGPGADDDAGHLTHMDDGGDDDWPGRFGTPWSAAGYLLAADSAAEGPTWLRIRVSDRNGRQTADVQVPLSIVRVALRVGARWVPQLRLLDPAWVLGMLRHRAGKPVFTFKDAADGDRVVITVE